MTETRALFTLLSNFCGDSIIDQEQTYIVAGDEVWLAINEDKDSILEFCKKLGANSGFVVDVRKVI